MKDLEIYCVSNKTLDFLGNTNYEIGWVGKEKAPKNYLTCDSGDNIFYKEKPCQIYFEKILLKETDLIFYF